MWPSCLLMGTGAGWEEVEGWRECGGGGCCADERRAGRGNLGGGQETESVAVERGHSTAVAFSGRFSLFCWWGDGLTPEEQGLRAVGVEHATREQEMQELCTTGRSVGGCFFFLLFGPAVSSSIKTAPVPKRR